MRISSLAIEVDLRMAVQVRRRAFIQKTGLASLSVLVSRVSYAKEGFQMYGIIGKIVANPGERDHLIGILLGGTQNMPGCIQYVVSKDTEDEDAIWITEFWKDQASHQNSMSLPSVQKAIAEGKPLIATFAERHTVEPVGGQGL